MEESSSSKYIKTALRDYTHVKVELYKGKKVVVKKIGSAEKEFYSLFTNLDFVLYPIKIEDDKAYYKFLKGENIQNMSKVLWEKAVEDIAILKNYSVPKIKEIPTASREEYIKRLNQVIELSDEKKIKLDKKGIKFMLSELDGLDFKSITHDDLIAPNILVENGKINIIDWEHVRLDFKELDIGRLLGDIYWDKPEVKKTYYPYKWHDDLVETYLNHMKKLNKNYDTKKGASGVKFGELWNYLGPIYKMLKNSDGLNDPWFNANVDGFNNIA